MAEQFLAEVVGLNEVSPGYIEMIISPHRALLDCTPGQFINIAVQTRNTSDPLLRRPFSLYKELPGGVSILFRVQGLGTRILAEKKAGDKIDILAPLGRGFSHHPGMKSPLLIGGGVGCPPLYFLASKMFLGKYSIKACLGFANKSAVICSDEFNNIGEVTQVVTDDGSYGRKALVTEIAEEILSRGEADAIYACGPKPMLKAVQRLAYKFDLPAQLALEEMMACGIGACLSCVVKVEKGTYKRVCKEGPVFDSKEVIFT